MNGKERVNLFKVIEKMNLVNLTPDIDVKGIWIHVPEFNRPALQLTGFYDQFDNDRIQIIGNVEYAYLKSLSETERYERYMQLLSSNIPCLIFCRNLEPEAEIIIPTAAILNIKLISIHIPILYYAVFISALLL